MRTDNSTDQALAMRFAHLTSRWRSLSVRSVGTVVLGWMFNQSLLENVSPATMAQ